MLRMDLVNQFVLHVDSALLHPDSTIYRRKLHKKLPTELEIQSLERLVKRGYRIIDLFGNHLSPGVIDHMLKSLENLEHIIDDLPRLLRFQEEAYDSNAVNTGAAGFPQFFRQVRVAQWVDEIAQAFQDTVRDFVHLHNILNEDK